MWLLYSVGLLVLSPAPSPVFYPLDKPCSLRTKVRRTSLWCLITHGNTGGALCQPPHQPCPDKSHPARNKKLTAAEKGKAKPENTGTECLNQHRPAASLQSAVYEAVNYFKCCSLEPARSPWMAYEKVLLIRTPGRLEGETRAPLPQSCKFLGEDGGSVGSSRVWREEDARMGGAPGEVSRIQAGQPESQVQKANFVVSAELWGRYFFQQARGLWCVIQKHGMGSELKSWLGHLLVEWPWQRYLPSLWLSLVPWNMGMIIAISELPWWLRWKNLPAMHETWVWIPWVFSMPGESPWTEEPDGLQSMGSERVIHDWVTKHIHACVIEFLMITLDNIYYVLSMGLSTC